MKLISNVEEVDDLVNKGRLDNGFAGYYFIYETEN